MIYWYSVHIITFLHILALCVCFKMIKLLLIFTCKSKLVIILSRNWEWDGYSLKPHLEGRRGGDYDDQTIDHDVVEYNDDDNDDDDAAADLPREKLLTLL